MKHNLYLICLRILSRANRKAFAIFFPAVLISMVTFSQSQGIKWQRPIGASSGDNIRSIIETPDGNILTTTEISVSNDGDITGAHGLIDNWVCKQTTDGRILWSKAFGSTGQDYFLNVHNSPDGGVILIMQPGANDGDITGYHGYTDVFVVKLSSVGVVLWKRCIGGSSSDNYVSSFVQADGSTIILGNTFSTDGDFPANHGAADIFLCKIDNSGNLVTAKTFGGSDSESFQSIIVKPNGNFLILGRTISNNSGQIGVTNGNSDIVLMEVSSDGTFLWSKTYGGSLSENAISLLQLGVNKFALYAETTSSDGDMVGAHGASDLWIAITDSLGAVLNKRTLGGSADEYYSKAFYSPFDSSALIISSTNSFDGDVVNNHGGGDIWMLKINNQGVIQWKKTLGGSGRESVVTLKFLDAKVFFLANTTSNDGDVSGNHGKTDFWTGMIDEAGNLGWQKCLGGSEDDLAKRILIDSGQIFVAGDVNSKDGNITGMHFSTDTVRGDTSTRIIYHPDVWVASLSLSGTLNWQKALGGYADEQLQNLLVIGNDVYVGLYTSSNDGDVFKNHGFGDTWVVRLGPSNKITGKVFLDKNSNGVMDAGEPYLNDVIVESRKTNYSRSSIPYNGWFTNEVDTGNYTTSLHFNFPYYTSVPLTISSSFSGYLNTDSISFAVQPIPNKKDLIINAVALSGARPGSNTMYKLYYKNIGTTTIASGEILFIKDSRLTLLSSLPPVTSVNGDTLHWSYTNLAPEDTASITLQFNVAAPPAVNIGDTLRSTAIITPVNGDETPANDTSFIRQRVSNSTDPNDKTENGGGIISPAQIVNGNYLNYVIRFQNTGNDTAYTVVVKDTLDDKLDWSSLQMIAASNSYNLSITDGNKLTWTFYKISLPDSNLNEPASHGFIAYRILPKITVAAGDTVHNTASVYFDFNLPVLTNNALVIIQNNITLPLRLLNFSGSYQDNITDLKWTSQGEFDFDKFIVERSVNSLSFETVGTVLSKGKRSSITDYYFNDDVTAVPNEIFYYRLKMIDRDGQVQYSSVLSIHRKTDNAPITIFPNPVTNGFAVVMVTSANKTTIDIQIIDNGGKVLWIKNYNLVRGINSVSLHNLSNFPKGVYTIHITSGAKVMGKQIMILK